MLYQGPSSILFYKKKVPHKNVESERMYIKFIYAEAIGALQAPLKLIGLYFFTDLKLFRSSDGSVHFYFFRYR